eukprot:1681963-Pyramimonas_sp.AAC.1
MTRLAKKLQLAPGSGALLDHAPVRLEIAMTLPHIRSAKKIVWDRDRVALALQTPGLREPFLAELDAELA